MWAIPPGRVCVRKLLEITTGRHPYQVLTAAAGPLAATVIAVGGSPPASLILALPHPWTEFWLALLAVGGIVTLVGAYGRGDLDNMLITEAGGVALYTSMITIYAAALFLSAGLAAAAAGGFLTALAAAGWWRVGQIVNDVRKVWAARAAGSCTAQVELLTDPDDPEPGRPHGGEQ